ncbi:M14 family zinc carboxypeptidase [Azohydromonas aeria]|uniref:M14 family zinc carboxypeptidase n=1 Tax=Azohydromonas aeria TaxID=2590212 RepID=UPI0012FBF95D|nr:M14 family zinc carboxypeptidase [Azohydromonas aeria]
MSIKTILAAALAAAATLAPAHAQTTVPNGPYGDNDSVASLRTYEQLVAALKSSAHTSRGAMTYGELPWKSNTGRAIPYVVVGTGPAAALIIAQQHGDEMETSDSAVNLARTLANNSTASKAIRNALRVIIVPRVNVDGFDGRKADGTLITDAQGRVPPWRQNYDRTFSTGSVPAFYQRGRGYDINRYHAFRPECPLDNPNFPNIGPLGVLSCENELVDSTQPYTRTDLGRGNPVPEARNIRWLADQFTPVVTLDLHHQGTRVNDGNMVTASTLWPTAAATAQALQSVDAGAVARFTRGQTMAKRVVVVIAQTLAKYPYADLSLYPGGTEPGISRNAYGLLGSGSVLLELRGGIGTKSGGYIQKIGYHASYAVLEELARDADLRGFDPNQAEILVKPANGQPPRPGQGESEPITDGTVAQGMSDDEDDHHLGN